MRSLRGTARAHLSRTRAPPEGDTALLSGCPTQSAVARGWAKGGLASSPCSWHGLPVTRDGLRQGSRACCSGVATARGHGSRALPAFQCMVGTHVAPFAPNSSPIGCHVSARLHGQPSRWTPPGMIFAKAGCGDVSWATRGSERADWKREPSETPALALHAQGSGWDPSGRASATAHSARLGSRWAADSALGWSVSAARARPGRPALPLPESDHHDVHECTNESCWAESPEVPTRDKPGWP